MAKATIFCAIEAIDKLFDLQVDANNEVVATDDKGHILKFPAPKDKGELLAWISSHKAENEASAKKSVVDNAKRQATEKILEGL